MYVCGKRRIRSIEARELGEEGNQTKIGTHLKTNFIFTFVINVSFLFQRQTMHFDDSIRRALMEAFPELNFNIKGIHTLPIFFSLYFPFLFLFLLFVILMLFLFLKAKRIGLNPMELKSFLKTLQRKKASIH